ncbi:MAG: ankyrin repeat domain-containing protein [Rhodocyclaceae bacterium]|nr:ankyrin repeat domain-containing protein [Rhodocyclaceae bacterium]
MPTHSLLCRAALALALLAQCVPATVAADTGGRWQMPKRFRPAVAPGFDCSEADSTVQDVICASDSLAALDRKATELYRTNLRTADLFGRDQLLAGQRRWLTGRTAKCAVPAARLTAERPDGSIVACLETDYQERLAALSAWQPAKRALQADSDHPLSAYVQLTAAESLDSPFCDKMRGQINAAIKDSGEVNPARIPGAKLIAGSHGNAESSTPPIAIVQRDAGPYASYELRATGLKLGGGVAIDERMLGQWISEQPNYGGRPSDLSSQTNDYAAIDAFSLGGSQYALVAESWGYYTPAASGESAYAGLYAIDGGSAQRRCLFKIYLRPPVRSAFADLPAYAAFKDVLEAIRSSEPSALDVTDRRDEDLLRKEQEWQLLNLPLLHTIEARQFGWSGWLRRRHDVLLEKLFLWSEGSLAAKQLYRTLIPTLKPAMDEVALTMRQTQGITAEEAAQATDLLAMELLDHTLAPIVDNSEAYAQPPSTLLKYKPRFPVLPERADLEKGRPVATLYGTLLNRLPAKAVADFIEWEAGHPEKRSFGRNGETALMAAVLVPEAVAQLLAAGADPNEADRYGFTPLMLAARYGQRDSAAKLIEAGAHLEAQTQDLPTSDNEATEVRRARVGGKPPLYFAALGGDPATVQLLLERGASAGHYDSYGSRPCDALKLNPAIADAERAILSGKLCPPVPSYVPKVAAQIAAPAAQAEFFSIERPTLRVGDRWKVETRDKRTNALKRSEEIVVDEVTADRIKLAINGMTGIMSTDLTTLESPQLRCDEGYQFLSFPLTPGKQWSFRTAWEHRERKASGRAQMDVSVIRTEQLKLPGGEVDAYRMEAQGSIRVESPIRLTRRVSATYWYAPSMRAIVRMEWIDGVEDSVIEVVGFSLAP